MAYWFLGISAAVAIIGTVANTGISYYSQQQQAQNAQSLADYNSRIQQENARVNAQIAQQQAQWNQQKAAAQFKAQQDNATALDQQALAVEAQGREQARRTREDNERQQAMQRSRFAKAGVTTEGTPLAVMAESSGLMELAVQDGAYQTEMESRTWRRKAEGERFEAGFSLMDEQLAKYDEAVSVAGRSINLNKAAADKFAGYSDAQGYRTASYGTLVSGIGEAAGQASSAYTSLKPNKTAKVFSAQGSTGGGSKRKY